MKQWIKKILGINEIESSIKMLEDLLLDEKARLQGFGILKKYLRKPDEKYTYMGKEE